MKRKDTYSRVKSFEFPNMVVRVQFPDLTPNERNSRLKAIHNAAEKLLKAKENNVKKGARQCTVQAIR